LAKQQYRCGSYLKKTIKEPQISITFRIFKNQEKVDLMKRRNFIKTSLLGVVGVSVSPATVFASRCDVTSVDILGPYWSDQHPYRTILAHIDEPGTRIFMSGVVTANDCETPIVNAVVDVWHANADGCYTVFQECDTGNPDNDPYNLRGQMTTNENGEYAFESIWPGYYGSRPKHFHYKITTPDGLELINQCYFEGDPQINDSWEAQHGDRIIPLEESEGNLYGIFDIAMDEAPAEMSIPTKGEIVPSQPYLNHAYPNPFNNTTQFEFGLNQQGHVSISIYNIKGQWVSNLVNGTLSPGLRAFKWDGTDGNGRGVPSGSYLIVMKTGSFTSSKKIALLK